MTNLQRLFATACAAATLIAGARASAAEWPEQRLVVIIWERRAPQTDNGAINYGMVQRANREAVVSLLYGNRPLIGPDPSHTAIAIYPEGLPANDPLTAGMYGTLTGTPAEKLGELWLPRMLSRVDAGDPLHPLFFRAAPERGVMDSAIRAAITYPLTGVPADAPDESYGAPVDTATRAISHPPLVTPYALFDAARQLGLLRQLFTEVSVVWVHGGERNYAITIPQRAIRRDYGEQCAAYYRQAQRLYAIAPDETRNAGGELADGNVTVWRVRRSLANQDLQKPRLLWHLRPASFEKRIGTLDVSMLPPDLGQRLREARVAPIRNLQWKIVHPDSRLRPIEAVATFHSNGRSYRLSPPQDTIPIGRLVDEITAKSSAPSFSDNLDVAVRYDAVEPLPPHLAQIALRIPIVLETNSAPVTFSITPMSPRVTEGLLLAIAVIALYLLIRFLLRLRPRSLTMHVQWEKPGVDVIALRGPSTDHKARFRFWLLDQSGYGPPWLRGSVPVELSMGIPITEVPLRTPSSRFTSFSAGSKGPSVKYITVRPSRSPLGRGTPVELFVEAGAVDFTRLHARHAVNGAYSFTIRTARTARYRPVTHLESKQYRADVSAFPPEYAVYASTVPEIESRGLFYDPKLSETEPERQFQIGSIFADNPTTAAGPALDIQATPLHVEGHISAGRDHYNVKAIAMRSGEGTDPAQATATIRNAGTAQWDVFLTIPSIADWTAKPEWQIRVDGVVSVRVDGSPQADERPVTLGCAWYPVNRSAFICLDLGTSATRLLVQGSDDAKFGFLPFPDAVRANLSAPDELPAICSVDKSGSLLFGNEALMFGRTRHFRMSVKQRLLDGRSGSSADLERYIDSIFRRFYAPAIHAPDEETGTLDTELIRPDAREGSNDTVRVARGPRHLAVCTIPNEAPPSLLGAYETAVKNTTLFQRVLLLREAEAVAFDFIDRQHRIGGPGRSLRLVALDVGAGTSDVAVVSAVLPPGHAEPTADVIAAAGVSMAGDHMDRAIFEYLAASGRSTSMPRDFAGLEPSAQYDYLHECDLVKRAIASGQERITIKLGRESVELDRESLDAIYDSPGYQNALSDIVDEPIRMLLGRLPAAEAHKPVSHVVLTGRGSLIKGVRDRFLSAIAPIAVAGAVPENANARSGMLKAAVSLGARSYVRKQWAALTLTQDRFPDRIAVIGLHDGGTEGKVIIDAGTPYDRKMRDIHREVALDTSRWSQAVVVRTYLRDDDAFGSDLQLDERARDHIVAGRPLGPSGLAYSVIARLTRPAGTKVRHWKVAVRIAPNGNVTVKGLAK